MSGPDGSGYYTATIKGNGSAVCGGSTTPVKCSFPSGAKMRTVALQSYFTQVSAPTDNVGGTGNVARHAISVVNTVNGDTARRTIVNAEKCSACHEWFEGHGGNRVKETQVCVMCHNTGLATSGRGIADAIAAGLQRQHRGQHANRWQPGRSRGMTAACWRTGPSSASRGRRWH